MPRYSTASASEDDSLQLPSLLNSPHLASPSSSTFHNHNHNNHPSNPYANLHNSASNSAAEQPGPGEGEEDDEEDEDAWDEVDIPQAADGAEEQGEAERAAAGQGVEGLEIVIQTAGAKGMGKNKKPGSTLAERKLRQERHKVHVLSLMAMGIVRNKWLNDAELQARILSQVPLSYLSAFTSITRASYPNARDRSRLFDRALQDLISWFFGAWEMQPEKDLTRRDTEEVDEEIEAWREEFGRLTRKEQKRREREKEKQAEKDPKGKGKGKATEQDEREEEALPPAQDAYCLFPWVETTHLSSTKRAALLRSQNPSLASSYPLVRPYASPSSSTSLWEPTNLPPEPRPPGRSLCPPSLYAAAAVLRGSKDLMAQMFVALLRAVDVPARLVVSLQGVEWRSKSASGGKAKAASEKKKGKGGRKAGVRAGGSATGKGKGKAAETESDDEEEEKKKPAKGKGKATVTVKPKPLPSTKPKPRAVDYLSTASASASDSKPLPSSRRSSTTTTTKRPLPTSASASSSRASSAKPSTSVPKSQSKRPIETITLSSADDTASASASASEKEGWEDGRGKLNYKVPKPNLRRGPSEGQKRMAAWKKERELRGGGGMGSPDPESLLIPPTQWIEAYTRYNKEWITVDVSRKRMRCRGIMEPGSGLGEGKGGGKGVGGGGGGGGAGGGSGKGGKGNVMAYVVAFEEDGSAHDVTPRYAHSFTNTTLKLRVPTSTVVRKANGGGDWFAGVVAPWKRAFQLDRDKLEEEELWKLQRNEPFPSSMGGFKNHPNYVLESQLHRDEALLPSSRPLGIFKATHRVFRRTDVVVVKSRENWYRTGRLPRADEVPMKWVKGRVVTINNRRREEFNKQEGREEELQGMWSEDQTEVWVPEPVREGKVPKNDFGNIDLFVPSMLPAGAVHLPSKVAAKCAKQLGIDYAEAITGFEFRQRRANPTIVGIVVAEEHAETLEAAIITLEQSTLEKALAKQQDRVLKRWKKLIQGLRIRQRLMDQFKDPETVEEELAKAKKEAAGRKGELGAGPAEKGVRKLKKSKEVVVVEEEQEQEGEEQERKKGGVADIVNAKTNANAAATTKAGKKRAKRAHSAFSSSPSRSPSPSASASDGDAPPPRKRVASAKARQSAASTSTSISAPAPPVEARQTRSSARNAAPTASTSTSSSTSSSTAALTPGLRIKLTMPPSSPAPAEGNTRERRPTRASAVKARGKLRLDDEAAEQDEEEDVGEAEEAEEDSEEEEDDEMELVEPSTMAGGGGGGYISERKPQPVDTGGGFFLDEPIAGEDQREEEAAQEAGGFLPDTPAEQPEAGGFLLAEKEEGKGEGEVAEEDDDDFGFEYEDE